MTFSNIRLNFISMAKYLAEPLDAAYNYWDATANLPESHEQVAVADDVLQILHEEFDKENIPAPIVAKKINSFIHQLFPYDVNLSRIILRSKPEGAMSITGSFYRAGWAVLRFAPECHNAMASEFTDRHKFQIAHLIARVVNDDFFKGLHETRQTTSTMRLIGYAATGMALTFLSPATSPMGIAAIHSVACTGAKIVGWFTQRALQRQQIQKANSLVQQRGTAAMAGSQH